MRVRVGAAVTEIVRYTYHIVSHYSCMYSYHVPCSNGWLDFDRRALSEIPAVGHMICVKE